MIRHILFCTLFAFGAFAVQAETQIVKPESSTGIGYADGKIGKAVQLNEKSRIYFDSSSLNTAGGTVEMWIRPEAPTPENKQNFLISNGTNNPSWFFWGYDEKGNNFLSRCREEGNTFQHYSSIRIPYKFPVDEWSHVALVWCNVAPGESLVQLYVNGKAVIEKFDQSLGKSGSGSIGIGCNTSNNAAPAFIGLIDELHISNTPRAPQRIFERFESVKNGKPVLPDDATLLYLDFEGSLEAKRNAAPLSLEELSNRGNELLDLIVGE